MKNIINTNNTNKGSKVDWNFHSRHDGSVESEFWIQIWEFNRFRTNKKFLSLECVLYAKCHARYKSRLLTLVEEVMRMCVCCDWTVSYAVESE